MILDAISAPFLINVNICTEFFSSFQMVALLLLSVLTAAYDEYRWTVKLVLPILFTFIYLHALFDCNNNYF